MTSLHDSMFPHTDEHPRAAPTSSGRFAWWLRFSSSSADNPQRTWHERRQARRSDFLAWLILGMLGGLLIVSPIAVGDIHALLAYLVFAAGLLVVLAFNRQGWVYLAGSLLVLLFDCAILGYMLSSPLGLTMGQLPNYDMLAIGVVVSATVLPQPAAFVAAFLNAGLIVADYLVQPHNVNIAQDALLYPSATNQTISLVVRPIALGFILAVVASLWVRSMERAILRADRAEELAALERRERERTLALEEGVWYVHQTLDRWTRGDLRWRVPVMPVEILEQVRVDLNLFIGQFEVARHGDFLWHRVQEETRHLIRAIERWVSGSPAAWPAPSGTPLDQVVDMLSFVSTQQVPFPLSPPPSFQTPLPAVQSPWQHPRSVSQPTSQSISQPTSPFMPSSSPTSPSSPIVGRPLGTRPDPSQQHNRT
jgi:hypothetical protein